jgi:hypothetical protein
LKQFHHHESVIDPPAFRDRKITASLKPRRPQWSCSAA